MFLVNNVHVFDTWPIRIASLLSKLISWFSVSSKDLPSRRCRIAGRKGAIGHMSRDRTPVSRAGSLPARPWASSFAHLLSIDFTFGALASLSCSESFGGYNYSYFSPPCHRTIWFSSFPKPCSPISLPLYVPLSHQELGNREGYVSPEEVMGPA